MRVGQGFDAHRFRDGGRLVIGGVAIPYSRGVEAHSDGDVLLHAIADALLGAIGSGDLGRHFPDLDPSLKGIDSRRIVRHVYELVKEAGYCLGNVDCTVIAQQPKLASHIKRMQACIAEDLQSDISQVSVKATTTEGMGFTGRQEGIAAQAVVLLVEATNGSV